MQRCTIVVNILTKMAHLLSEQHTLEIDYTHILQWQKRRREQGKKGQPRSIPLHLLCVTTSDSLRLMEPNMFNHNLMFSPLWVPDRNKLSGRGRRYRSTDCVTYVCSHLAYTSLQLNCVKYTSVSAIIYKTIERSVNTKPHLRMFNQQFSFVMCAPMILLSQR